MNESRDTSPVEIRVNGEARSVPAGSSVADLLAELGVPSGRCAVEIDRRIVPRSQHGERRLATGESLEIVTFVGGG